MRKIKVFLGDFVHTWEKVSVWTVPINIGYIGGFLKQEFGEAIDLRLFKRPEEAIVAIREEKPDVLGLSHYVWNLRLNKLVSRIAREVNPGIMIVGGGPQFTDLNYSGDYPRQFFSQFPDLDAYTLNQGEKPNAELMRRYIDCGCDVKKLRSLGVAGCLVNDLAAADTVHISDPLRGFDDLDSIPSPYLTGLMDEFFDGPYLPLLETNRSCPYRCAYCAWGIGSHRLTMFSLDRIFAEIEYIGSHVKKYGTMMICDANFGLLERDVHIAGKITEVNEKYGFPTFINVQWNKSNPERIYRVGKAFKGLANVGSSRQSTHGPTLEAIGRENLPIDEVTPILHKLKVPLFTELILGLPYETKESHLNANRLLMDGGYEVNNYNLHMLPGTRMDGKEYREKFVRKTAWRLHDNAWGIYDGETVMEGQEVVIETSTMAMAELRSFRFIHFLFQFMWGKEWYRLFLLFMKDLGVHPVDFIDKVSCACETDDGVIGKMRLRFAADHDLENFQTFDELFDYWAEPVHFERLRSGDYGKLNMQYTYEVLLDSHDEFNSLLSRVAADFFKSVISDDAEREAVMAACDDVLTYQAGLRFQLTDDMKLVVSKIVSLNHDVLDWVGNGCKGMPAAAEDVPFNFEFYLDEKQRDFLQKRLEQFQTGNLNMALRKLSEYLGADLLFFKVRRA